MAPTTARELADCPQLPPPWGHAQVMAESPGNRAWSTVTTGGAAGLYQLSRSAWTSVEGDAGA